MQVKEKIPIKGLLSKPGPTALTRALVTVICFTLTLSGVWAMPGIALAQVSLKDVPVKEPPNLSDFVKNKEACIALGKALFWDMQVGSDGVQACASCHFHAGADNRTKNQLNPGTNAGDTDFGNSGIPGFPGVPGLPQLAPDYDVTAADFPFHSRDPETAGVPRPPLPGEEFGNVVRDCNDVMSSQGVRWGQFLGIIPEWPEDDGKPLDDPVFRIKYKSYYVNTRRVEPRNTPTVINAVFNGDNFWEGRASMIFNGVNPFGFRDRTSTLKQKVNGALTDVIVRIPLCSLASQAVGPPVSDFEMSFVGRDFPSIGRKLLSLRPLAKQLVHPQDSVLGHLSRAHMAASAVVGEKGLNVKNYAEMIKKAFKPEWWSSNEIITIDPDTQFMHRPEKQNPRRFKVNLGKSWHKKVPKGYVPTGPNEFTQMEYNFSLFFGLAIQCYEATLVADDTPFDRFKGAEINYRGGGTPENPKPIAADPNALTEQEQLGLDIYQGTDLTGQNPGPFAPGCSLCHTLPETTEHTIRTLAVNDQGIPARIVLFLPEGLGGAFGNPFAPNAYFDFGMRNLGHRPSNDDIGRDGTAPDLPPFQNPLDGNKPFPLAYTNLAKLKKAGKLPADVAFYVPDLDTAPSVIPIPGLPRPVGDKSVTKGNFKVPNLRNGEYTGPYFHDGTYSTLRQVVQFYARGANFPATNFNELAFGIIAFDELAVLPTKTPEENAAAEKRIKALVAFLAHGLTDERVVYQKAPFDHPQLFVADGCDPQYPMFDKFTEIPAVGENGQTTPISTFLNLDPQTP